MTTINRIISNENRQQPQRTIKSSDKIVQLPKIVRSVSTMAPRRRINPTKIPSKSRGKNKRKKSTSIAKKRRKKKTKQSLFGSIYKKGVKLLKQGLSIAPSKKTKKKALHTLIKNKKKS